MEHGGGDMFGIIGKIFGTDKAAAALVSNTTNALDKLWYTSEEKAEDKAKATTEARTMVIEWMKATSGQNLARRLIALVVTSMWVFTKTMNIGFAIAIKWVDNPILAVKLNETLEIMQDNSSDVTSAMMLVLAFYFSAPFMGDIAKGALNKFGK